VPVPERLLDAKRCTPIIESTPEHVGRHRADIDEGFHGNIEPLSRSVRCEQLRAAQRAVRIADGCVCLSLLRTYKFSNSDFTQM
jgi:hypothetical protein